MNLSNEQFLLSKKCSASSVASEVFFASKRWLLKRLLSGLASNVYSSFHFQNFDLEIFPSSFSSRMASKKQAMSAAERKWKSWMNKLKTMSEEEEKDFKEKQRERVRKAMQNKWKKEQEQMTPTELRDFKNSETARIKASRNKKDLISKQKEKQPKETAITVFKMTASSQKNPYKTQQSHQQSESRTSSFTTKASCCCWRSSQWIWISGQEIQKQFQTRTKPKTQTRTKSNSSITDKILFTQCQGKEMKWQSGMKRESKNFKSTIWQCT